MREYDIVPMLQLFSSCCRTFPSLLTLSYVFLCSCLCARAHLICSALEAQLKEEEAARKASQQAAAAELSQELKAQTAALKASGASKAELLAAKDAALVARRKVEAKQVSCDMIVVVVEHMYGPADALFLEY